MKGASYTRMNHPFTWPVSDGWQLSSVEIGDSIDEGIFADYFHEVHAATEKFIASELLRKGQREGKEEETEDKEGRKKERNNKDKK